MKYILLASISTNGTIQAAMCDCKTKMSITRHYEAFIFLGLTYSYTRLTNSYSDTMRGGSDKHLMQKMKVIEMHAN